MNDSSELYHANILIDSARELEQEAIYLKRMVSTF